MAETIERDGTRRRQEVVDACWERTLDAQRELEAEVAKRCHRGPSDPDWEIASYDPIWGKRNDRSNNEAARALSAEEAVELIGSHIAAFLDGGPDREAEDIELGRKGWPQSEPMTQPVGTEAESKC